MRVFGSYLPKKGSYFLSKTEIIDTTIEFCLFKLVFVSNFTFNNCEFLNQICPRKIFMFKSRNKEHHHWILHIHISVGTKFYLKLTILIFLSGFAQKGFFCSKAKKVNTTIFYIILHIKIVLCEISAQTDKFNFLDQIFPKRYFRWRTEKVNIIIELCIFKLVFVTNFCLNWKFLFFWPDLP